MQKIYFSSYIELSVTLVALAIGMWWLFDRSRAGLTFSIFLTLISFTITHSLLRYRLIRYVKVVPPMFCKINMYDVLNTEDGFITVIASSLLNFFP